MPQPLSALRARSARCLLPVICALLLGACAASKPVAKKPATPAPAVQTSKPRPAVAPVAAAALATPTITAKPPAAPLPARPAAPPASFNWRGCTPVDLQLRNAAATYARAQQADACAQYAVGLAYDNGLDTRVNDVEAAMWYQRAADLGHAEAQNNLGLLYLYGQGVGKDLDKARSLLLLAERGGLPSATLNLGLIYADEAGAYRDDARALSYFRRAAELGLGDAQYNVGMFYRHGRGVKADDRQALQWYEKAAAQNIANAQVNLGVMYYEGRGMAAADKQKAAQWYRRAAQLGVPQAQFNLGLMLSKGEAMPKNLDQARIWFSEAAQQGYGEAQAELAELYAAGLGTPKNPFLAYYWQRLYLGGRADKSGAPRERMEVLAKALSAEQIQQVIHKIWLYDGTRYGRNGKIDPAALEAWQQRNQDFLAANRRIQSIQITLSGLQYQILKAGSARMPGKSERVTLNYRLSLIDGDLVDASDTKATPVKFQIDKVVAGIGEGLQLTGVGGKTRLFIPASLGYADRGAGVRIPPGSTLVLELELLRIEA